MFSIFMPSIMAILCWLALLQGKNNQLCASRVIVVSAEGRSRNLNSTPPKAGISADSGVCEEQLPWGTQHSSHSPRHRGTLPAPSQHRIQGWLCQGGRVLQGHQRWGVQMGWQLGYYKSWTVNSTESPVL